MPPHPAEGSPLERFRRSMSIDYRMWRDGIGYDLDAIDQASPDELEAIEGMVIDHAPRGWRDIEALAELDTPRARGAMAEAADSGSLEARLAVLSHAPRLVPDEQRTAILVEALRASKLFEGLSQALDLVEAYHPPEVVDELFRGVLEREGEVAPLFAGMLIFVHGKSEDAFDMGRRPFLLRFNTGSRQERERAFAELCAMLGVDPERYRA